MPNRRPSLRAAFSRRCRRRTPRAVPLADTNRQTHAAVSVFPGPKTTAPPPPRSIEESGEGAADRGPVVATRPTLFHDAELEGSHENRGRALAGNLLDGAQVLAIGLNVARDQALTRCPGEGARSPHVGVRAVHEGRQVATGSRDLVGVGTKTRENGVFPLR